MPDEHKKDSSAADTESKDKKSEDTEDEAEADAGSSAEEESLEEESEEEDEASHSDKERDYDAEIEEEKKRGKPDPLKAAEAWKKRDQKRKEEIEAEADDSEADIDEDDKPLTRREARELMAATQKTAQEAQAYTLARGMAASDKEAELIVLKWRNRNFPEGASLNEQIEESFFITHGKKILGRQQELARALKNKDNVNRNAAGTHRTGTPTKEPKVSSADVSAIKAAGFSWNGTARRYEKKLKDGSIIVRNKEGGATRIQAR